MGMYTGFRFKGTLKDEFVSVINYLMIERSWKSVVKKFPQYNFLAKWSEEIDRSDFIPFGAICYMPKSWHTKIIDEVIGNKWQFTCSLKNYEGEIEEFINNVLPNLIISSKVCETLYEEHSKSTKYVLKDGKLIEKVSKNV